MDYNNMTPLQLDALKEVSNIGTGNAATALSQLLGRKIDMNVPDINIVPFEEVMAEIGEEKVAVGVLVRVLGDTPGNILFVFEKSTALDLVHRLTGMQEEELSEMGNSVMCEIGNIISASYMNAIARFTNLTITPSVPAVSYDMLGAILSTTFIEAGQYNEHVLDIETVFKEDGSEISGHFYYIPMPGSLEKILNTLGVS
ncbi:MULTISPECIES: chemotaxis protein CheC [Clostridium]|jgi:chemotaxis protein CheC|uniref:CheC-like family protein n=4 Tax=Clostridium TaxID=1485 RepID=A0A1L3NJP5_CLOSG|nr:MULTISPECIES: chemotaxis protein CheC [Clostridium]AJD29832.1 cheC-like family protein [Clostridium botulinum Prevot_594]MBE6077783.1 chemotaxis protein CheC [Clostridium lundense]AKC63540.1 CheY-P phosphatase CheC [Clostridium sporogenes]AKJ90705.1 chemotaxis protein CheY [Clostridium sporogenes]APH16376.1 cheC-like family protein [Clostridium sporogenes]